MGHKGARERIGRWSARGAAGFCAAFAAFQVALALGAPWGGVAWGGASPVLPPGLRVASAAAAAYLALASAALLMRSGDWGRRLPQGPARGFAALLAVQFTLNTLANVAAQRDAERFGMGMASALGALLCLGATLRPSRP